MPFASIRCLAARAVSLALVVVPLAASTPAAAQDAADAAGAVISLIELADTEYADAVANGEIANAAEYEEATEFTAEALRRLAAMGEPVDADAAAEARATAEKLPTVIERRGEPAEFAELAKLTTNAVARGWNAVRIRLAEERPSARRGARVYRAHCAACHGPAGGGDGPAAAGMEPPPGDLTAPIRHVQASLRRDFEVTSFGIPATSMAGWGDRLTLQERWDVATYIQGFRFAAAQVAEGRDLALSPDAAISGLVRPWTDPEQSMAWTDKEFGDRVASVDAGLDGPAALSVVAYLRAQAGQPLTGVPSADRAAVVARRFAAIDSMVSAALLAAEAGDRDAAGREAIGAYMAFEALESMIGARSPARLREVEARFAELRADIATAGVVPERGPLDAALAAAASTLASSPSAWGAAVQSFVIILREGFEAILIIGAIMAFLLKTGREENRGAVRLGVAMALVASLAAGILLEALFAAVPARREILEGVTMLVAVGVLFSVSYWLVSKLQHGRWEKYLREKMTSAVGAGSQLALASVAFLAVFREGVETVLFYKALGTMAAGQGMPIVLGFLAGTLALGVVYVGYTKLGVRIPMRPFFAMTSAVLYFMAVVFAGAGVSELQEAGVVGLTPVAGVPTAPALGVHPTVETLAAQGVLVALFVGALFVTFLLPRFTTASDAVAAG